MHKRDSMTRYSIQPKDRMFLKGYRFLHFIVKVGTKILLKT